MHGRLTKVVLRASMNIIKEEKEIKHVTQSKIFNLIFKLISVVNSRGDIDLRWDSWNIECMQSDNDNAICHCNFIF